MFHGPAILLGLLAIQDPATVLQAAREAQAEFERARRGQLPLTLAGSSSRCDERIGQLCYWYDAREADPPPEGPAITTGRQALLVELGAAGAALPADPWLVGQRVRYLLEAGQPLEAEDLATGCAAKSAWCAMLHGWALHASGRIEEADSAFSRGLAALPANERCQWLDLGLLLTPDQSRSWRRLSCSEQSRQADRWLEFGRALMAVPGNSLRTELLARQVVVRVVAGTVTPYGTRFNGDHREMVLRYGWTVGWSRVPGRMVNEEASIIGHDPSPAWGLLPTRLDPPEWELNAERPRSRFQPPGVMALREVEDVQLARFPRGDRIHLVAAWQVTGLHPLNTPGTTAVLTGKSVEGAPEVIARMEEGRGGVVLSEVPRGLELAGVELLHPNGAVWGRHRAWWAEPLGAAGPILSDLLLFEPDSLTSDHLEDLLPRVLRGHTVRRGGRVGVYWEWSGITEPVTRLQVSREGGSRPLLAWSWPQGSPDRDAGFGSMVLDLARLSAGRYHLDVVMTAAGREIRSRRLFVVR